MAARPNLSSKEALSSRITLFMDSCCSEARSASLTVKLSHSKKSVLSWPALNNEGPNTFASFLACCPKTPCLLQMPLNW